MRDDPPGAGEFRAALLALLPRLHRFARSLCRPPLDADDLMQSTCERALARQTQFQSGTRLDSWLFSIMHSIWKNELRHRAVERTAAVTLAMAPTAFDGERHMVGKIFLADVLSAMQQLPADQAAALALVNLENMTYAAAAETLNIPQGTLESRLARGRIALGRLLDETRTAPAAKLAKR